MRSCRGESTIAVLGTNLELNISNTKRLHEIPAESFLSVFDQYSSVNFGIANKDSYMEGNRRSNAISGIPLTLVLIFDIKIRPACLLGTCTSISRKHLSTTRTDSQQPRAKIRPTCQFVYAILTNG